MKISRFPFAGRAIVAATIAAIALIGPAAGALPPCVTPVLMTAEYARDDANTISWFGDEDQSGGFLIHVSSDSSFMSIEQTAETNRFATDREFTGLEEREYFYRVRAKKRTGVCEQSQWSNVASTIQDSTPPQVEITTKPEPLVGGVTPPVPVYIMKAQIWITGTATDIAAPSAPSGVGPASVALALENTTPVVGGSEPPVQIAQVTEEGTWQVRYCANTVACPGGKPGSGTYTVSATGIDRVGNAGEEPVTLGIIIVL